ncbi:MAG: GTPase HflX [Desulfurococcales archaeon]|nr:GTPase HflX [Desulfurococcales archaeon]
MKKALLLITREEKKNIEETLCLLETAGYEPTIIIPVRSDRYLSRIKLNEIEYNIEENAADIIIFFGNPKPSIVSRIMKTTGKEVMDRTLLILEIFDQHAGSKEARLQIELARLKHITPLVREMVRRKRMGEMPGFMGPGMYGVERYYRHIKSRTSRLRRELEYIKKRRGNMRKTRSGIPHTSIVGYASAGKTSLFNKITGESKPVGEEYFTTLQPKHKAILYRREKIVFIDTVGFIRDIPPEIIEAFHATLEETVFSDLIIFVLDVSENYEIVMQKLDAGLSILSRIEADVNPIVLALNKIDKARENVVSRIEEEVASNLYSDIYNIRGIVRVSAVTGYNIPRLIEVVHNLISSSENPSEDEALVTEL